MIKAILFDTDGVIVNREMNFSRRFSQDFGIPLEAILPFFENEFQSCLVGKADLKDELETYLEKWTWKKSADELLDYWFRHESSIDGRILEDIDRLRRNGIKCYLDTNNERYRSQYLLDTIGLKERFDGTFSSAGLGYLKPQKEFWEAIYKALRPIKKEDVLVWDDDLENIDSAREFGFKAKLYTNFNSFRQRMRVFAVSPV